MRRILLFLFMSTFLLSYVSALDCQYKQNETYSVEEEWFYFNGNFEGVNLKMDELVRFENNGLSFKIYNNLTIPIKVQLNYSLRSQWFGIDSPTSIELDVEPRDSKSYQEERISSGGAWGSYYWIDKFIPTIIKPEVTSEYKNINKQREICRTCPNGKQCLDDNSLCNSDNECGSSICNIVGFCGKEKIVECPNGLLNCNNQTCLSPSTKESGEGYSCLWECKSGIGKAGICKRGLRENLIFFVIILICLGIGLYFIFKSFYKKGWDEKGDKIIKEAEEKAKKIIEKSQTNLEKLNYELMGKIHQKEIFKKELDSLKNERTKSLKIKDEIIVLNKDIENLSQQQKEKSERLKEEREKFTKERLTPFTNKQGYKVYINEEGYEVLERTGTLFHRWWFEHNKNRKIKSGYEIHHEDFNKRNNDIKNLEEITPDEHKAKHYNRYK